VTAAASRFHYGWVVVAALFVMLTTASGLAFYNLSVFMNALVETRGFPVGAVSSAIATFFVATGVAGLLAARMLDALDPRWTIALGGVLGALALLALGHVTTLPQLYAVYALFGAGHAFAALVPATTLVTRWFETDRSIALSVASTGLSIGGVLVTPISVAAIESLGLPGAAPWFAAAWFLGIVPITLLVVRRPPGDGRGADGAPAPAVPGWRRAEAIRSRWFVMITIAWILILGAQVGGIAHLFNLAATRVDAATGATAVSLMASCSIVGRFVGGWLIARTDTRIFALVCVALQALAMSLLALAHGGPAVLLGAGVFGATVGNLLMLQPLILAEAFGTRDYGRIFSLNQLLNTVGVASGPAALGWLFDGFGGYGAAFALAAGAAVVAFGVLLVMGALPDPEGPARPAAADGAEEPA
jgi:MFS family permease